MLLNTVPAAYFSRMRMCMRMCITVCAVVRVCAYAYVYVLLMYATNEFGTQIKKYAYGYTYTRLVKNTLQAL